MFEISAENGFWRCKYGFVYYSNVQRRSKDGTINPHTAEGAVIHPPPLRFFADSEKTTARGAAKFAIAVQPTSWHISKKDDPMSPKVTPPGHNKWPDLKLHFSKFESLSKTHHRCKLFGTHSVHDVGIYDLFISDFFLYRWPQVMSISWPPH